MQGIHGHLLYQSLRGIQEDAHPLDVSVLPIGVREAAFVEAVGCFAAFIAKPEVHIILQTIMLMKSSVACMSKRTSWQTLRVCTLAHVGIDLRLAMPDDVQMSCLSPRSCLLCDPEAWLYAHVFYLLPRQLWSCHVAKQMKFRHMYEWQRPCTFYCLQYAHLL